MIIANGRRSFYTRCRYSSRYRHDNPWDSNEVQRFVVSPEQLQISSMSTRVQPEEGLVWMKKREYRDISAWFKAEPTEVMVKRGERGVQARCESPGDNEVCGDGHDRRITE